MSRRGTNIRKRTDGRWEGRYYIVDTAGSKKCKSVYGHSYKEVTERLLSAKAASLNQTIATKQSAITVKAVAEKWLESMELPHMAPEKFICRTGQNVHPSHPQTT